MPEPTFEDFLKELQQYALRPLPMPGPVQSKQELAIWFRLFARDCRAALPAAA